MDDCYAINLAKTEIREAYNSGDVDRLLSVFNPSLTNWCDGIPGKYGLEGSQALRQQASELFDKFHVKVSIIVVQIVFPGDMAYDRGYHEFTLTPKQGGDAIRRRERYFEIWHRSPSGEWKIDFYVTNQDVREELNGVLTRWFASEQNDKD